MRKNRSSAVVASLATLVTLLGVSSVATPPTAAQAAAATKVVKKVKTSAKAKKPVKVTVPAVTKTAAPTAAPKPASTPAGTTTPTVSSRAPVLSATDTQMVSMIDGVLTTLTANAPAGAAPGTWKGSTGCFRCDAGPALAAAAAAAVTGDAAKQSFAEKIFDYEIATQRQPNGAFGKNPGGPDIDTMFFASELGIAAILLKPRMDPARYARWSAAVAGGADFLINNKNLAWYTNGNIVLGNTLTMALAARLTGNAKYTAAYETALSFAVNPPQSRWPGHGFVYTVRGTDPNGFDGKGYFTEAGSQPGFDAEYSMLQLDLMAPLFLITGDQRVKMYMNLVMNQLWGRVNKTTWRLDTSGGTRRAEAGREFPFDTAALSVLANVGGRTDLAPHVASQISIYSPNFKSAVGDRLLYAFGLIGASALMSQPGRTGLR